MSAQVLPRVATEAISDIETRPVCFKVTLRTDMSRLNMLQRFLYATVVRRLPFKVRAPPRPPLELGNLSTFALADANCITPDDQIHVVPWNWTWERDSIERGETCRPRDPADWKRYKALREKYADYDAEEYLMITRSDYQRLMEAREMITESKRRMKNALRD